MVPRLRVANGIVRVAFRYILLRADVDYGFAEAHTTYGVIGVKVWIFKGEIYEEEVVADTAPESASA